MPPVLLLSCFVAAYALALLLEALCLRSARPALRFAALAAGSIGFAGHSAYIALHASKMPFGGQLRWLLYLAWILVVFYLIGEFRQRRMPWGLFVLPVVLILVGLGVVEDSPTAYPPGKGNVRNLLHGILILLASVGVCVGFVASVTYLVQARRLRAKALPGRGMRLLSLERLETINRRALLLSFPLLTAGVVVGVVALFDSTTVDWLDWRVLGTLALWVVFALLLYLRFAQHVSGRRTAMLTIVAFVLLLCCLAISHGDARLGTVLRRFGFVLLCCLAFSHGASRP
jgi:ABC-type transport system involved in cytochrome c biogenesis permease subunit